MSLERTRLQKFLVAAGFGGIPFVACFVVLGAAAPGYDSLRNPISALEFTSFGVAQRANFFIFGMVLCAFGVGLRNELGQGRGAALIPAFQVLGGIGVIGDALFVSNPMHMVCDLIAFNSALIVVFFFAWRFGREPRWKGWRAYSILTALLMMGFLTAFGIANHFSGPSGLMEKLASCMRSIWSVVFAARLLGGDYLDGR